MGIVPELKKGVHLMREASYDEAITKRVKATTGLSGECLDFVTNAAVITAGLGKFPTKVDACNYIGVTEREMDVIGQKAVTLAWADDDKGLKKWYSDADIIGKPKMKAMVYAVAADLILEGLLECQSDGDGKARELLKICFKPQQITSRAEFDGFLVTLEYLRHRNRGFDSTFSAFIKLRYNLLRKRDYVAVFSELVSGNNPTMFPKSDYSFVINRLSRMLKFHNC